MHRYGTIFVGLRIWEDTWHVERDTCAERCEGLSLLQVVRSESIRNSSVSNRPP